MSQPRLDNTQDRGLVTLVDRLETDVRELKLKQFTSNKGGIVYYETSSDAQYDISVTATPSIGTAVIVVTPVFTSATQRFPFAEFVPKVWHTAISDTNLITEASSGGYNVSYLSNERQLGWSVVYTKASAIPVTFFVKAYFFGTDKGTFTIDASAV